jgi:molybdopterin converting factor small subunit
MAEPRVTVELLGLARHRAGRAEVIVAGRTVADLLRAVVRACPGLGGILQEDGRVSRQYLVSLDGERFIADPGVDVPAGGRLLILGADPGG